MIDCIVKKFLVATVCIICMTSCNNGAGWLEQEKDLIDSNEAVMHVCTIGDFADSLMLRTSCTILDKNLLHSEEYTRLVKKMKATVTSPEHKGVGIAGPQVGINRRVVVVKRVDKEGTPFEAYPNIFITEKRGEKEIGSEGCLSVPGKRGNVPRWRDITIKYSSPATLQDTTEIVTGYTAVIFQHETDHLDGILYTDYLNAPE